MTKTRESDIAAPNETGTAPEQAAAETPDALAAAQAEAASFKDKLLRTLAEMENLRKRTEREVADARSRGVAILARDILDIADNLHRALEAVSDEARSSEDSGLNALVEGVELTERSLANALQKHGVKRFDPAGEKFDPNLHQAMYEVPDASVPPGTVVQVMQPGYMIGDRMLRPAMVAVAKGGVKEAKQPEAETRQDN
jgi:molecular chaperone GrpE